MRNDNKPEIENAGPGYTSMDSMDRIVYLIDNSLDHSRVAINPSVAFFPSLRRQSGILTNSDQTEASCVQNRFLIPALQGCAEDENKKEKSRRSRSTCIWLPILPGTNLPVARK